MTPLLLARLLALGLLLAWAALLGTPFLEPSGRVLGGTSLLDLRSPSGVALVAGRVALRVLLVMLRFAPLGALSVVALPNHPSRPRRATLVALPAALGGTLLAWFALAARAGSAPGPFEILLPGFGVLLGVWAGLAWRRGWRARIMFLPSLLAQALVLMLLVAGFAVLALDSEPALGETLTLTSAEKRQLVERFQGKNPRKIPPGETRTLQLTGPELDRLAGWAALSTGGRVRPAVRLQPGGLSATASLRFPRTERWLNVSGSVRAGIQRGRLTAQDAQLSVGQIAVPSLLLDALTPFLWPGSSAPRANGGRAARRRALGGRAPPGRAHHAAGTPGLDAPLRRERCVLSAVAPSDAAGLLKEELDADGGSGFSFGDLLADRAGTTFADVATRDEASALRMQQRLAGEFRVDDFFPLAADLPEGIPDAELQSHYGGVGGPLYRRQVAEIERRLALCAAYRE